MELSAWPQSSLNADEITDERIKEIRADLDDRDIEISALGYYPNYLAADKARSRRIQALLPQGHAARRPHGGPRRLHVRRHDAGVDRRGVHGALRGDLFTDFCVEAEDLGIRIGIENCPMLNHKDRTGENLAFSPEIWTGHVRGRPLPRARPGDRPVAPGLPRHRLHPGDLGLR